MFDFVRHVVITLDVFSSITLEPTPSELINEQFKIWELQGYMVFLKGMFNISKMILTFVSVFMYVYMHACRACTSHMGVEE